MLKKILSFLSPYAHPFEKKVDRFFKHVKSTSNVLNVRQSLLELMQKNLVVVNVWMEKEYKGYKYLSKSKRRKMYADAEKIAADFKKHADSLSISMKDLREHLAQLDLNVEQIDEIKLIYLAQIMDYLKPGRHYHYIKTASFGKLLRDPGKEKLEGDCNQIVTLYAYLYSLNFSLDDLQIKVLPGHVCLHFKGIDIEATNATFQNYEKDEGVAPITELISTNMLDLTDFREEVQKISPRTFVKSAQLAKAISSLKDIVEDNLRIAYQNVARSEVLAKNFDSAIFFYEKAGDKEMVKQVYRAAAIHYMEKHDFKRANQNAVKLNDSEFEKKIRYQEGAHYYNLDSLDRALKIFKSLGENEMVKACYGKQYNQLVKKVSGDKTLADLKRHKSVYKKLLDLAVKMGDENLQSGLRKTLSQL